MDNRSGVTSIVGGSTSRSERETILWGSHGRKTLLQFPRILVLLKHDTHLVVYVSYLAITADDGGVKDAPESSYTKDCNCIQGVPLQNHYQAS